MRSAALTLIFTVAVSMAQQTDLRAEESWALRHNHGHVQGIDVSVRWFWVSAVDRRTKTGWVWRVDRRTLQTAAERNIAQGTLYHAGGLQMAGNSLWVPIAEYRPHSSSRILELDAITLAERRSFPVADHIGAVATDGKTAILGANWAGSQIYRWGMTGEQLRVTNFSPALPSEDMKWIGSVLYVGGIAPGTKTCVVDQLDPYSLAFIRRFDQSFGTCYSREGMAVFGGRFFFLPDDEPRSRIYVREVPR